VDKSIDKSWRGHGKRQIIYKKQNTWAWCLNLL
jgi:hypothetical protein